ncbi:MAG: aminotransferase class I/II-fold pyridoxal phosphate-dependent enzyme [Huintestinicola sp.]
MKKILVTRSSMPPYDEYIEAIRSLWDTHWLTNMGIYHQQLESKLKEYLDVPNLSLMVNGHMALELTIQSFGFPEGSEIITTPFTFISTTHAIVRNRLKPIFCDVNSDDGTIDENKIENLITENTVAIIPVHVYGNICNIEAIQSIADKYNLKVIYDAAHAFGIKYKNKGIGNYGDASIFSFHATKVFNTVEGGAVTFDDKRMYDKLYNLKNFGIRGEELVTEVGANAKMNELSAIMGLCNLNHLSDVCKSRRNVFNRYVDAISTINGLRIGNKSFQKEIVIMLGLSEDRFIDSRSEQKVSADVYFECVGKNETVCRAINETVSGGKIMLVGNPYSDMTFEKAAYWKILRNQLTILGTWNSSFTNDINDDWHYVLNKLSDKKISPSCFISHKLRMPELEKGLLLMRDKMEDYIKVMMVNK